MRIIPYQMKSAGAKALADALGCKRVKHEGKAVIYRDKVINWGCSGTPRSILFTQHILNSFDAVARASNKLSAFKAFGEGVSTPKWTEKQEEASTWLREDAKVVCRTILNGHSGNGIVIASKLDELVDAPLYTRYTKKSQEYRVHVHAGAVFFVQRKARDKEVPNDKVNWLVRNHHNGFIYANKDVEVDVAAQKQAIMACAALGLDFGAVDIIRGSDDKFYVLEVNTAPGLAGTTLDRYVEQFSRYEEGGDLYDE